LERSLGSIGAYAVKSSLKMKARFNDPREAEIVLCALSPDNKPLPSGLELKAFREGSSILVSIRSRRPLLSLLYTADDILSKMVLAKKTLNGTLGSPLGKRKERGP